MVRKTDRTPLQQLQDEAVLFLGLDTGLEDRAALDAFMVRAYDMAIKARREVDAEIIRNEMAREVDPRMFEGPRSTGDRKATYVVSSDPDRIEDPQGDAPVFYATPEDAGDGILQGWHGEAGTRYVLKVELSVEATYDRAWTLVREPEPPLPFD
jgi:hypothetical protein